MTAAAAPEPLRRPGRPHRRPRIGMLTGDLTGLHTTQWLGVVDAARARECDLVTFSGRALDDPGFRRQSNAIYDLVGADTVDGLVIWTGLLAVNVGGARTEAF